MMGPWGVSLLRTKPASWLLTLNLLLLQNLVEVGDEVYPGQVIGTVGRTGRTTAYHLHFEIWNDGKAHDPIALLSARPLLFAADDEVQPEDDGDEHE